MRKMSGVCFTWTCHTIRWYTVKVAVLARMLKIQYLKKDRPWANILWGLFYYRGSREIPKYEPKSGESSRAVPS